MPSVCSIPPQAGDEGMSGVGGVVLSSGAIAIREITILHFLLLLVCTPVWVLKPDRPDESICLANCASLTSAMQLIYYLNIRGFYRNIYGDFLSELVHC